MSATNPPTRRLRLASLFVVVGGGLWLVLAGAILASTVFGNRTVLASSGASGFEGYPPGAVRDLVYATYYYCLFVAVGGFLGIVVGAIPLRRGERWALYATLGFSLGGLTETVLDGVLWNGWWVFPFYALFPVLGLAVATWPAPQRTTGPTGSVPARTSR